MIKCCGKVQIDNGIRIVTSIDICLYYRRLIHSHYYETIKTQVPSHGAHITVANPKIHKEAYYDLAKKYLDKSVEFFYSPEDVYISNVNFWFPVKCEWADNVRAELNINDGPSWWGYHLTVCNKKFNN